MLDKINCITQGWYITSADAYSLCGTVALAGTSMSTPLAAGAAVLVREYFLSGYYPRGVETSPDGFNPSGALIKAVLIHSGEASKNTVNKNGGVSTAGTYPSNIQGYGRISIGNVLNFGPSEGDYLTLLIRGDVNPAGR